MPHLVSAYASRLACVIRRCRQRLAHGRIARCTLLSALALMPMAVQAALTCQAPAIQAPCGASSPLGPAHEPGPDSGLGNPIHLPSGEKFLREIDVPQPTYAGHPSWVRLYRAGRLNDGPLGRGWQHEYDIRLHALTDGWRLDFPDGRSLRFDLDGRATGPAASGWLDLADPEQPQWHNASAMDPEGRARHLVFDHRGRLKAIGGSAGPRLQLEYHSTQPGPTSSDAALEGLLKRVGNPAGALLLNYRIIDGAARMVALDTPLGRFSYTYVGQPVRLKEIRRPDGMRRILHYEAPLQAGQRDLITGISLQQADGRALRVRTWGYDPAGRVVQAIAGEHGTTSPLRLHYDAPERHPTAGAGAGPGAGLDPVPDPDAGPGPGTPPAPTTRTSLEAGSARAVLRHSARAGRPTLQYAQGRACPICPTYETVFEYDTQDRLARIGDLTLGRDRRGQLRSLRQTSGGWPGLQLHHDARGLRNTWASVLTGQTRLHHDAAGRLQRVEWADGRRMTVLHDDTHRPTRLRYSDREAQAVDIHIQWRGPWPERLVHPMETEVLARDQQGRVRVHQVQRPLQGSSTLSYQERFEHDARGRLMRHELPEGGVLHYRWSDPATLRSLSWEDPQGRIHPVLDTLPGLAGYRYGNGLHLQGRANGDGQASQLVLSRGDTPLWGQQLALDRKGRITRHGQWHKPGGLLFDRHYPHDAQDRQIGQFEATKRQWWAWRPDGSLLARAESGRTTPLPAIMRNPAGLPLSVGTRSLRYNAQGRLAEVRQNGQLIARHDYNARGHQIRSRYAGMHIERYYLDNRLVGLWRYPADAPRPGTFGISQRYLYANQVPVGLLQTDAQGRTRLYFIHADLQGTPVRITDEHGAVRWQAVHDGFGQVLQMTGDLQFPLRRPGQVEDPATGWYDNVFRTYLPERGHYLEPDPLGPLPGQQALGHGAQQFLRHADPLGLILLAFDGTRQNAAAGSNVWKLAQIYADGAAYYHAGPGRAGYLTWDAVTAASSQQILKNQWQSLLNAMETARGLPTPLPIDILGFSRGAALAREFANRIARNTQGGWFSYDDPLRGTIGLCVDLRFMGLFDTVAQFGLLGSANAGYDLSIAGAWQWVAHAVATHEYRVLFPLVSVRDSAAGHTIEAPFIGAHSDIGGGLFSDLPASTDTRGDLSDVALNWMVWQALAAEVPLAALSADDRNVSQPLLHDERAPLLRGLAPGDRLIQDSATRSLGLQGTDPVLGQAQRQLFEAFIERIDQSGQAGNVVGQVDMQAYARWLQAQWGLPAPLAQPQPL